MNNYKYNFVFFSNKNGLLKTETGNRVPDHYAYQNNWNYGFGFH